MDYREALIPAAGRGARLDRPDTIKPLVEVGGRPLIWQVLEHCAAVGIERAWIVVGYRGDEIERRLFLHPELPLEVRFVHNDRWEDGLARSVLAAADHIEGEFILAMADHVFGPESFRRLSQVQLGNDAACMLVDHDLRHVFDLEPAVKVRTEQGRVARVGRTMESFDAVDVGAFACHPTVFDALSGVIAPESEGLAVAIDGLARAGKVRCIDTEGERWFDVDTPSALVRAEMEWRRQRRTDAVVLPKQPQTHEYVRHQYEFTTGKPAVTEVVVERGFVRNPSKLPVIPADSSSSPIFVFTDERVGALYGESFVSSLRSLGYRVQSVVMREGEKSKTLENYVRLVNHVLARGIDERSLLISLGGGAVCNVCGFVASTLYRGIDLIHVPTTLMAQCDAAISHKQGVNGARGKNLVGSYYPPTRIVVDVDVLATLDDWLIPDGLAEVVKHALGQDADYLESLLDYHGDIRDPDFLQAVVSKNIELKCVLMERDPKEQREGMVLQYGHEIGHPVEFLSGYALSHGQSVAIGMMASAYVSSIMGGCGRDLVDLHREVIQRYRLPVNIPADVAIDDILTTMRYNKRYLAEGNRLALVERRGRLWSVDGDYAIPVSDQVLREALRLAY